MKMRRQDRESSLAEAYEAADTCAYATLSTVSPEGMPYGVPVSIVREGGAVYFHCAQEGEKLANILKNPSVCVTCVSYAQNREDAFSVSYRSAILTGKAALVLGEKEKIHALSLLCKRHAPKLMRAPGPFAAAIKQSLSRTAVVRVEIEEITGKQSPGE